MKGITQDTYGSTDVLEFRDVAEPDVGEHDVLVRVEAAGVEIGAWHVMAGKPYLLDWPTTGRRLEGVER